MSDATHGSHTPQGFSIRWRKSSATFVIYEGRNVFESGFETEQAALNHLTERLERQSLETLRTNGVIRKYEGADEPNSFEYVTPEDAATLITSAPALRGVALEQAAGSKWEMKRETCRPEPPPEPAGGPPCPENAASGTLAGDAHHLEWCEDCSYPLSPCGEQDSDGEPTLDCLPCRLSARIAAQDAEIAVKTDALDRALRYLADLNGSAWIPGDSAAEIDMRQRACAVQKAAYDAIYPKHGNYKPL